MIEPKANEITARVAGAQLDEDAVKTLTELLNTFRIMQEYLNDQVVKDLSGLASTVFKLVNAVTATDMIEIIERSLQDPGLDKALLNPQRLGALSLLLALLDKDVQRGMGIMIAFLKAFGRASLTYK